MLTRDLTPCFVQDFGLRSRTGYEKALLVGLFDKTSTCLEEFFAVDDEIMVGPCSSRDESAHEFGRWKISREINRYNAMKEFLDDARRRD